MTNHSKASGAHEKISWTPPHIFSSNQLDRAYLILVSELSIKYTHPYTLLYFAFHIYFNRTRHCVSPTQVLSLRVHPEILAWARRSTAQASTCNRHSPGAQS
jgi:hypothetical protein